MAIIEYFPLYVGLTHEQALDVRMALNLAAISWGDKARVYRANGQDDDAATCERIRSDYHRLWERVAVAMERPIASRERDADAAFAHEQGD